MLTLYLKSSGTSAVYAMYFRWVFVCTRFFVYIDRLAKIDTQLHTEVKVEEIIKVISPFPEA